MLESIIISILASLPSITNCDLNSCQILQEHQEEQQPQDDGWYFIDKKHWVAEKRAGQIPEGSDFCPGGDMVKITGKMATDVDGNPFGEGSIIHNQQKLCTKWINEKFPERCLQYDQEKWEAIRDMFPRKDMDFCIDPYEWPNKVGEMPWVMITHTEASSMCEERGKRLCTEEEWTFACEGEEVLPYPYGYRRDDTICNIDHQWRLFHENLFYPRGTQKAGEELKRLWQGHASGDDPQCKSPFGVHDMTGNIDEWTTATHGDNPAILKGCYWGPDRNRCRPSTRNHLSGHTFYQQGFRCCADLKDLPGK
jgi:hypothetical protein